ncbi:MAG: 3-phosphoshikimate 1-carboxyvinyltransferase [Actinomycetaceae bacterium]|nr:3-phosphoshikimate 1-carboxyvinyltransferase [Actinomycetaceae bacterium]
MKRGKRQRPPLTRNNWWHAPVASRPVDAEVRIPGSKSLTNRMLVLAALSSGISRIRGALSARDTDLMVDGLRKLGASIDVEGDTLTISPIELSKPARIHCGLAGTVMRFLPAVASLGTVPITFTADEQAQSRPITPLLDALRSLDVTVTHKSDMPFPVTVQGPVRTTDIVHLDSSASSQFVTAILLIAPLLGAPGRTVTIILDGDTPSRPHIDMTVSTLRARGIRVDTPNERTFTVSCGTISPLDITIEPDLSNAGPFLAAALVTGGRVSIPDWPAETTQAGNEWISIVRDMGGIVSTRGSLTVSAGEQIRGIKQDFSQVGELVPTVTALAALATTPSELTGIGHLRGHETDRLSALANELRTLGIDVIEGPDYLRIDPTNGWRERLPKRIDLRSYHDHRMATFGAIIGLSVPGVRVENIATTSKTLPDFPTMWEAMLA